jgi:signal transduction histidine kinase
MSNSEIEHLKALVVTEPKQARRVFKELLEGDALVARAVLEAASVVGEGRLRQMIAVTYRLDPSLKVLEPFLRSWKDTEPDEFARTAIEMALSDRGRPEETLKPDKTELLQLVEAYRYVSDRLCHRIRQALTLPNAQISHLEAMLGDLDDPGLRVEVLERLASVKSGFVQVSRNVEFDIGDDYLAWHEYDLFTWLEAAAREYGGRWGWATLQLAFDPKVRTVKIRATRFLLETLFGNIWTNAVQQVKGACTIKVHAALDNSRTDAKVVELTIIDNGPGFPEEVIDTVFRDQFSTKQKNRGQGLLEVADAVSRLGGDIRLVRITGGECRIQMRLPVYRT